MTRTYPAKLLLFGEYTVLSGSQALAVPATRWKGSWVQGDIPATDSNQRLAYFNWLQQEGYFSADQTLSAQSDLDAGWTFDSNIPIGYGLGSSGAYVAAILDRYILPDGTTWSTAQLVKTVASMEGYFHGASSGMDPLVSYSRCAVLRDDQGQFHEVADPGWPEGYQVYLLDSGLGRTTGPLVELYHSNLARTDFRQAVERDLIPYVEHAIHFYLNGAAYMLEACIGVISEFQRKYFDMLIPEHIQTRWDTLANIPGVYVKFCGAGGGGYFLVIDTLKSLTPDHPGWDSLQAL